MSPLSKSWRRRPRALRAFITFPPCCDEKRLRRSSGPDSGRLAATAGQQEGAVWEWRTRRGTRAGRDEREVLENAAAEILERGQR